LGGLDVRIKERSRHHQMLPHTNRVLLAERSQLVLDRSIQLEASHIIGDRRLRQPRLLGCEHRAATLAFAFRPAPLTAICTAAPLRAS